MTYPLKRNLQLGNFVEDYEGNIWKVESLNENKIMCIGFGPEDYTVASEDKFIPIKITSGLLRQAGIPELTRRREPLHDTVIFEIKINGTYYNITLIEFQGQSIATFNNYTLLYFHQLQNVLKIYEPTHELSLFS